MSKYTKEEIGKHHFKLTLEIEKSDYEPRFNLELTKMRNKAQIKGFRKGKVPISFLQKMYGESVLADVFYELVGQKINDFVEQENIDLVGYPIPADGQNQITLDPTKLENHTLHYEIGFIPSFELNGLSKEDEIEIYDVTIPDEWVDDEINRIKRSFGDRSETEEPIKEGDIFTLTGKESNGAHEVSFQVYFNSLTEDAKDVLKGMKKGDKFQMNVFELEEGMSPEAVRKYFLEIEDEDDKEVGELFDLEIEKVVRITEAEMNKEILDQAFGPGEVENEQDARDKIREYFSNTYATSVDSVFFTKALDHLAEKNTLEIPMEFLKKWLHFDRKIEEDKLDDAAESFANTLRRRTLISRIIQKGNIKVSNDEVRNKVKNQVRRALQGQPLGEEQLNGIADNLMKDKNYKNMVEEAADEAVIEKVTSLLKDEYSLKKVPIEYEDFKKVLDEINQKYREEAEKFETHDHDHDHDHDHEHDHEHEHEHDHRH